MARWAVGEALGSEEEAAGETSGSQKEERLPWSLEDMSEEELAAMELSEEDLLMDEEEEAEWRQYDEEVRQYRELMAAAGEGPGLSESGVDSLLADVLEKTDIPLGGAAGLGEQKKLPEDEEASLNELLQSASSISSMQDELRELLLTARSRESEALAPTPSGPGFEIPAKYRAILRKEGGGVVVTRCLGPNTVVLLSRAPDNPELLPEVSEVFRVLGVTIQRGWLASTGDLSMDVFEVCDTASGKTLTDEGVKRLRRILERVLAAPAAREVLFEVDDQVPRLDAFFGLPASGLRPPALEEVRASLSGGPLTVAEARDLGRVLVFRGKLEEGAEPEEALGECRRRFEALAQDSAEEWECVLCNNSEEEGRVLLLVLPAEDLKAYLEPYFNEVIVFIFALLATFLPLTPLKLQAPISAALSVSPSACVLVFGILAATELTRRLVSGALGLRLSLPFVVPSPTLGTFGAVSRSNSLMPSRTALFDVTSSALITAFLLSFFFIVLGMNSPPSELDCTWVNPRILPQSFGRILVQQADPWWGVCPGPRPSDEFVPAPAALVAGCFGAVTAALNALPVAGLDGSALASARPWASLPAWVLPSASALLVLALLVTDANAEGLLPQAAVFLFASVFIRPQLAAEQIFRDNVSRPTDWKRSGIALLLLLASFLVLAPTQAPP